jgi:hypothetical protein
MELFSEAFRKELCKNATNEDYAGDFDSCVKDNGARQLSFLDFVASDITYNMYGISDNPISAEDYANVYSDLLAGTQTDGDKVTDRIKYGLSASIDALALQRDTTFDFSIIEDLCSLLLGEEYTAFRELESYRIYKAKCEELISIYNTMEHTEESVLAFCVNYVIICPFKELRYVLFQLLLVRETLWNDMEPIWFSARNKDFLHSQVVKAAADKDVTDLLEFALIHERGDIIKKYLPMLNSCREDDVCEDYVALGRV